jgi:hypothetical protein
MSNSGRDKETGALWYNHYTSTRTPPEEQAKIDRTMDELFTIDPSKPFDLESIAVATHATIKYGPNMYQFNIIPGGNYHDDEPKTFTINNDIPGEEGMNDVKTQFLTEILNKRIVLTVDDMNMKPADIIISHHHSSSDILGGVYEFKLVTGSAASEAGGGGAAGGVGAGDGSKGGGKSVRRRSRKRYSRRRRVSNKKYSASRRGRGRGRGRGRRSRKN